MPDGAQGEKLEGEYRGGTPNKEKMSREEIDREHMTNHGSKGDEASPDGSNREKEGAQGDNLGSTPAGSQGNDQPVSPKN